MKVKHYRAWALAILASLSMARPGGVSATLIVENQTHTMAGGENWSGNATWWNPNAVPYSGAPTDITEWHVGAGMICRNPTASSPVSFPGDRMVIDAGGDVRMKMATGANPMIINWGEWRFMAATSARGSGS